MHTLTRWNIGREQYIPWTLIGSAFTHEIPLISVMMGTFFFSRGDTKHTAEAVVDSLLHGPTKTTFLIFINGFQHKEYRTDLEDSGANEGGYTSASQDFILELGRRLHERQPDEERINHLQCALGQRSCAFYYDLSTYYPNNGSPGEDVGHQPGNIIVRIEGEHLPNSLQYSFWRISLLRD